MSTSSDLSPLELANRTSVSSLRVKRITVHVRNKKLQKYRQKGDRDKQNNDRKLE